MHKKYENLLVTVYIMYDVQSVYTVTDDVTGSRVLRAISVYL